MYIDLKELKWLPFSVIFVLVIRMAVSLNVFPALQMYSYLVLALTLLSFVVLAFLYLRENKITVFGVILLFYFLFLFGISIIKECEAQFVLYDMAENLLILMLFAYYEKRLHFILQSFSFAFSAIVYVNLAIMVFYPTWMFQGNDVTDSFLLGANYNQMGSRFICAIITSVICVRYSKWWILNTVALFIVSFFTLLLVGSMTSMANIIIYALFCLIPSLKLRKAAVISMFVLFVFVQVFVVFNGESIQKNEIAVYLIEDVMEKDITFTGRTHLWETSGELFSESPLIGYGKVGMDWYASNLSAVAKGPHNFLYATLLHGGLVLFFIYGALCWVAIRNAIERFESVTSYILMGVFVIMFMMTMEVFHISFVVYLLTMAFYNKQIIASVPAKDVNAKAEKNIKLMVEKPDNPAVILK